MKKKYILVEFVLVFAFLLLPPLFVSPAEAPDLLKNVSFSFTFLQQALIAVFLDFQWKGNFVLTEKQKFARLISVLKWGTLTFGFLMLIFACSGFISNAVKKNDSLPVPSEIGTALNPLTIFLLILNFFCSAFYEEVLYREFLPASIYRLCEDFSFFKGKSVFKLTAEVFCILIFAFAHRYMGFFAVANAALCAVFLRICFLKTDGVYTGAAVHFLYNMTMTVFSLILVNN